MHFRAGVITGAVVTLLVAAAGWWIVYRPAPASSATTTAVKPATVAHILKEETVNTITLTPEATQRLGITTAPITIKPTRRTRSYSGEVTIPAGRAIIVAAPLGGILQAPTTGVPSPGAVVRKGQSVMMLLPLLTPEARTTIASARVDADGQVNIAKNNLDAARIALERAQKMLRDMAGSQRNVDEAKATFDNAGKTLEAATARRDLLIKIAGEADKGTAAPIPMDAPADGMLRAVNALPGQNVPGGAALFEVVDLTNVWIRVPVYVGDGKEIDTAADAAIGELVTKAGATTHSAKPVVAPPTANAVAATSDIYYELDNRATRFSPGQRVGVTLALTGAATSPTIPWSSVVIDIHGGTWVYEQTAANVYVRRRVIVRHVSDGVAALASGPSTSTQVVITGAAELFGTEIGFSK